MKWDEYFMGMAFAAAAKSKDPSTKVGVVLVDADRRIINTGYNGPPRGTDDDYAYSCREFKLLRTLHAELNAILFARCNLVGCSLYTTHHPCASCAAAIIQVGIRTVYHPPMSAEFSERWNEQIYQAQAMFREAGVSRVVVF